MGAAPSGQPAVSGATARLRSAIGAERGGRQRGNGAEPRRDGSEGCGAAGGREK